MKREYEPSRELPPTLVTHYAATFIPRVDRYPKQQADGTWVQIKHPLTMDMVRAHLEDYRDPDREIVTLGAYALDPDSLATWVCLDADDDAEWEGLWKLAHTLKRASVPIYIEPSRRGGHVWLFTPKLSGETMRRFGKQLLAEASLETVELFPKQDRLGDGPGSLVRLPLGLHRKSDRVYPFIDLRGKPIAPTMTDQVRLLGDPDRVPMAFIQVVIARIPPPSPRPVVPPDRQAQGDLPSERIQNAVRVYDFVSQYVDLDNNGRGHCPFHDDQHQSFQVNREQDYWNCYAGCGGGSIIHFWAKWREAHGESADFVETIAELAGMLL